MSVAIRSHRIPSVRRRASFRTWIRQRQRLPEAALYGMAFLWVGTEHSFAVASVLAGTLAFFYALLPVDS